GAGDWAKAKVEKDSSRIRLNTRMARSIVACAWATPEASVLGFVRRGDPGGEAGPGFVAEQLRGRKELAFCGIFLKFLVYESVVKAGAGGVGGAGPVADGVDSRPVGRGQAHGAGLATRVELAAGQGKSFQSLAGRANGVQFSVSRG